MLWVIVFTMLAWRVKGAETKQESQHVTQINFAVDQFIIVLWNQMSVLINRQSGGNVTVIHYQQTVYTVWCLVVIFRLWQTVKLSRLLTILESDHTAIHHVALVCFIFQLKCVVCEWLSAHVLAWVRVCVCPCDEKNMQMREITKDFYLETSSVLSADERQCVMLEINWTRGVKKMARVWRMSDLDAVNEFMKHRMQPEMYRLCLLSVILKALLCLSDVPCSQTARGTKNTKAKWSLTMIER